MTLARQDTALHEIAHPPDDQLGGRVALRYVARAGLLPELSRQTYDSFPKALREAVLNSLDADATRVDLDLSRVESHRELTVLDDGIGMSMREFCEQFMSLGGSTKFGDRTRYGRIGIGSLALLQYADAAVVETKRAGDPTGTRARIEHPWAFARDQRCTHLGELAAGFAEEFAYDGSADDHFTRVRLEGVNEDVWTIGQDPTAFYRLLDSLRRILPLPWQESRLTAALERVSPELVAVLKEHVTEWSTRVYAHSAWERGIELRRRSYGDDRANVEEWSGPPRPLLKTLRVRESAGQRRELTVAGFLLNQRRANASWAGVTARVQNVAVEEHTFFDVTADPGFRKYITGEVWILGDVNRERLINIDRSSFNRECADYRAVQRFMSRSIVEFKSSSVQRPQRQKVEVRRLLEAHARTVRAVQSLAAHAAGVLSDAGERGLPSSESGRGILGRRQSIVDSIAASGVEVIVDDDRPSRDLGYELDLSENEPKVRATIGPGIAEPRVRIGGVEYRLSYAAGGPQDPPIVIRNRPREIVFNVGHPVHASTQPHVRYQLSLALELAYLLADDDAAGLYERMLFFMEAR